jgi:hypothetical protein
VFIVDTKRYDLDTDMIRLEGEETGTLIAQLPLRMTVIVQVTPKSLPLRFEIAQLKTLSLRYVLQNYIENWRSTLPGDPVTW